MTLNYYYYYYYYYYLYGMAHVTRRYATSHDAYSQFQFTSDQHTRHTSTPDTPAHQTHHNMVKSIKSINIKSLRSLQCYIPIIILHISLLQSFEFHTQPATATSYYQQHTTNCCFMEGQ